MQIAFNIQTTPKQNTRLIKKIYRKFWQEQTNPPRINLYCMGLDELPKKTNLINERH